MKIMQALHIFTGTQLSIARIRELSACSGAVDLAPEAWQRVAASRAIVERQIAAGATIYGTNTGIGSQKDAGVAAADLAAFSNRMILSEATDFPGPPISDPAVRAALVVLINMVAGGGTGMRPALVHRLLALYAAPRMPTVRADAAFGSADLTPLSQLSIALLGLSLDERAPVLPTRFDLAPKESVSLIDNNSFALGDGALVLAETERLLLAFDLAAASALEGFRGGLRAQAAQAAGGYRGDGQARSRENLSRLLKGSALHSPDQARFLQDPLSFRSITQINGAAYEVWDWARTQFEREINSSSDNPLVDLESGELFTSSSMVSLLPALAMDSLRQALAKASVQSMERALKLQSPPFTGLPVGLAADGAADGGIVSLNLNYIGSARMGSLLAAAAPVFLHYVGNMSDGVEDVTSLLPLSVTQTRTVIDRAWEAAALEMAIAVWAMVRRGLKPAALGAGPRRVYELLLPLLHIGEEGTRIFNMRHIVAAVRDGDLVEQCLMTAGR
ncbi:MAG TPA: aromatic amino acid lyase [Steroidobacteraceae bacterium]